MHILMILISFDFPTDIRVEKEARALIAAGHRVTVVCENRLARAPREIFNDIQIIRLPPQPLWWRQLNTAMLFITQRSPIWGGHLRRIIAQEKPDAIHVHDLPFAGPGLQLARHFGLPLVADMHENYPAYLRSRAETTRNWLEQRSFDADHFAAYERAVLPQCDAVIAVVQEAAERIAALGVPAERIYTVGNAEDVENIPQDAPAVTLPESEMKIVYVGGLQEIRGLQTVIAALPAIRAQLPTAKLIIVGDGYYRPYLEAQVQQLQLGDAVHFEGQQPFAKVHRYIEAGDVCIVPHLADELVNSTMPHKLFQYMYMGKAVIVSSARPLRRVVETSEAGVVFTSGDPTSFAQAVLSLTDPALRRRLGENGQRAVMQTYNWQNESRELVRLYAELPARTIDHKTQAGRSD
ncbi:MAG: glycosyltransferase family 4 protein [Anaerolineales bacterium]|nr:glycosyltransferase family 4 protein [Anaerolineales bacterium]